MAGKDVTSDIFNMVEKITYIDKVEGESDEIDIQIDDTDGLWRGPWYPTKGEKVQLFIGYPNEQVDCGEFVIDEIEASGLPDMLNIRGLAAGITKGIRTKNSKGYEQKTLKQIAQAVAGRNGLTVQGQIEDIRIERVTQNRETDLAFLNRIASEYGYLFSVRGSKLVFTNIFELEKSNAVRVIERRELKTYSIRDKGVEVYKGATVKHHNYKTVKVVEAKVSTTTNVDGYSTTGIAGVDTKEIRVKAENPQQADKKAKAALHKSNSIQQEGSITVVGNPQLVAGINIEITGLGALSGKYHVMKSTHPVSRSGGYDTTLEIKRVGLIPAAKQKSK